MSNESPENRIGYGNPPKATRFQKGRSGNPSGRPRKIPTQLELLRRELTKRVTVTEGGRQRRLSKGELIAKQLVAKAVKGDTAALRMMMRTNELLDADTLRQTETTISEKDRRNADHNVLLALAAMMSSPEEDEDACA